MLVVRFAGQERLDRLGEVVFHLRRAASPAPRAGWPIAPWWALHAGNVSLQSARPPTRNWGHAFACGCGSPAGALGVRGIRLVVRVPI